MKLYLDENVISQRLIQHLEKKDFKIMTPFKTNLVGAPDQSHFEYCQKEKIPLLTKDAADFFVLHQKDKQHWGIIVIYEEGIPEKNMSVPQIVTALENLVKKEGDLKNGFFILNRYR